MPRFHYQVAREDIIALVDVLAILRDRKELSSDSGKTQDVAHVDALIKRVAGLIVTLEISPW